MSHTYQSPEPQPHESGCTELASSPKTSRMHARMSMFGLHNTLDLFGSGLRRISSCGEALGGRRTGRSKSRQLGISLQNSCPTSRSRSVQQASLCQTWLACLLQHSDSKAPNLFLHRLPIQVIQSTHKHSLHCILQQQTPCFSGHRNRA